VLFGGIYDWYDPILAVEAVAMARQQIPTLSITFTTHPNPSITPQGKSAELLAHVRQHHYETFVRLQPWVEYDSRAEFYARFAAALLTFPSSLETDLSMRTRVYDYLWAGLPVISSSAPGTDELIEHYGAGEVVRDGSASPIAAALVRVLSERPAIQKRLAAFAADHQWQRTLAPLTEFVRAPRIDPHKETFAAGAAAAHRPLSILHRLRRRTGGGF
jgi:Glycosyltransferase